MVWRNRFVVVIPLFLHAACLSMDKKIFPEGCAPQRHPPSEITVGYAPPSTPYRILGEITAQYDAGYERNDILKRLKIEAAECGADGILLGSFGRFENQWKWSDQVSQNLVDNAGYRLTITLYRLDEIP